MVRRLPRLGLRGFHWSIRGRIALAFVSMSVITIGLGFFAVKEADRSASLVRDTYDETVIATSYARAAAADFANMRAGFAHEMLSPTSRRDIARQITAALEASFQADLATAVEKSSADTQALGVALRAAVAEWLDASTHIGAKPSGPAWDDLDRRARKVEDLLESFVSRVSDRGYAFRQEAQATMSRNIDFATGGVIVALGIAGFVGLMLHARISAPIGAAARFAGEIAAGTLDGLTPDPSSDEIGDLIRAMVSMRGDIGAMMSEQVILREQSHARVAEALDSSREGVVIVDAQGIVQIINRRALDFLGLSRAAAQPGTARLEDLRATLQAKGGERLALLCIEGSGPQSEETLLPDGRWIQNSRNLTSEGGLVALYTDISAIRDQKDRLALANARLDAALGNMSQGLCVFDAANRLTLVNSRFLVLFELPEGGLPPGTPYEHMVAWVLGQDGDASLTLARAMRFETVLIRRRRSVSRTLTIGKRVFAVTQEPMPDGGWIATYDDITERRRAESQIAFLADHDALTRLPNRTMFGRRVEEALPRARRGSGFAVLCLDLDHFKEVNDTLGHAVGDELLQRVSERLLACVRETDTVARLGGDEFAILEIDVQEAEQAAGLAARVVEALAAPFQVDGNELVVGVSVGIALAPTDGLSHIQLLKSADAALYKAKDEGRGTWRFFEAAMDEKLHQRRALEADLRHAMAQNQLELHYQPLLDVRRGRIGCLEALLRWRHPDRGFVPPESFIPLAEDTGLIKEIGRWVLQTACAEAARWPTPTRVAVNVSAIQLRDAQFVQTVTEALATSALPADRLELEMTETVLMTNHAKVLPILSALRAIGVRFAMDDFGTGYSSLSTLRAFPFDKLKIDRSFVRDLGTDAAAQQIIRTILALGQTLEVRVAAEGVETRAELEMLADMGCDEMQGFHIGQPMAASQLAPLLERAGRASAVTLAA